MAYNTAVNERHDMDAYGEGYAAFHRGVQFGNNPYAEGGRWYSDWNKGWLAAARASSY